VSLDSQEKPMKIVVFGTGGVGGYFGGRLAQAGQDVTFIARGAHLDAMTESGLSVDSIGGDFVIQPVKATDSPESIGPVDLILLAVKSWQLQEAIEGMKPLVAEGTSILPLMNGVEHIDALQNAFGLKHVLGGLCSISALKAGPGHIKHLGMPPTIAFGELDNAKSGRVAALRQIFESLQGVTVLSPANILVAMWDKFIFIAALSGVGAVTRQTTGEFRANPEWREMLIHAMEETAAVGRARGVPLPETIVTEILGRIDAVQPHVTASMQKDIMAGRPSELDAQNGAVIRMGRAVGIPTPTHEKIYEILLPLEKKARGV
ncbi:MAG: 2-dehydropantoate 2-reductase, partial [Chloroflexota bacterium]